MDWKVVFEQDTDTLGDGTVRVSVTEADGTFEFSRRIRGDRVSSINQFVQACKLAYTKVRAERDACAKIANAVLLALKVEMP